MDLLAVTLYSRDPSTGRILLHAMPVMVLWGGPMDLCGLNFDSASSNLENGLAANGNMVLECVHNCGHAAPPVDAAAGIQVVWRVALDHPYWLADGESPWQVSGPPAGTPEWCSLGIGSATPRTGMCGEDAVSGSGCSSTLARNSGENAFGGLDTRGLLPSLVLRIGT